MNSKNDLPLVLYRYDQLTVRDAFIRLFQKDFELLLCESDSEAQVQLEKYGQKICAVVVERDAIHSSFFELSKALNPQSLCILFHSDIPIGDVVSLLEKRAIDKCFAKPYDCNVIRSEIYAAHIGVYSRVQDIAPFESLTGRYYALIVDDEPRATHYLKKQLDRLNCPCEIIIADNAAEALMLFRQYRDSLALVMTDQRMPGMKGNQLLTEIRNHKPNIIRILTSAYGEVDVALNAVNEGQIFRYIKKPWNAQKMLACIETALAEFLSKMGRIDEQHSLLVNQFQQIISKRKLALFECLGATVDAFAGAGSLRYFFDCLESIETIPATKTSLRSSVETSLEVELVSAFTHSVFTKLSALTKQVKYKQPEFAGVIQLALYEALSKLVHAAGNQTIDGSEYSRIPTIGTEIIAALQILLESSGFSFEVLDLEHLDGCFRIKTKTDKDISIFKHMLSAHTRLTRQMIEQQSAMLMLVLIVRLLRGDISIQGGEQKFSLNISLPDKDLLNAQLR
jgi:FixJ family two-component response regulator